MFERVTVCVKYDFFIDSFHFQWPYFTGSHKVKAELILSLSALGKAVPERTELLASIITLTKQASSDLYHKYFLPPL